jgi:hypothetical protein
VVVVAGLVVEQMVQTLLVQHLVQVVTILLEPDPAAMVV